MSCSFRIFNQFCLVSILPELRSFEVDRAYVKITYQQEQLSVVFRSWTRLLPGHSYTLGVFLSLPKVASYFFANLLQVVLDWRNKKGSDGKRCSCSLMKLARTALCLSKGTAIICFGPVYSARHCIHLEVCL